MITGLIFLIGRQKVKLLNVFNDNYLPESDFSEVAGQQHVKRALEIII
jgi:predicted ATPase with chaperone activity